MISKTPDRRFQRTGISKATAISLSEMGLPVEQIARGVKESVSIVQAWIAEGVTAAK